MSKKPIIGCIILAVIIGVIFVGAQINPDNPENTNVVFHVTLADPALYDENGFYVDYFSIEELWTMKVGNEKWRHFSEDFELQGTLVEDELSSWYVWDYLGEKRISFDGSYTMEIVISPNRNLVGPVSIDLIKLR